MDPGPITSTAHSHGIHLNHLGPEIAITFDRNAHAYAEKAGTVLEPTPSGCHGLTFSRDGPLLLSRAADRPGLARTGSQGPDDKGSDHG